MKMGNTSTYNREYYWKNRERINENAMRRRANMTAEQREKYLNRLKECYRKHHGYYVSRKQLWEENKKLKEDCKVAGILNDEIRRVNEILREENKKLKDSNTILKKGGQVVFTLEKRIDELLEENEQLKAIIEHYKKFEEGKKKLEGMLMEEDTLQELRDLGKI